jgi:low affinity Fe/Cu permease
MSSSEDRLLNEISEIQRKLDNRLYKDEKQRKDLMAEKAKKEEELRSDK